MTKKKVLLVDDQSEAMVPMAILLETIGCEVNIVFNGYSAIEKIERENFDLLVIDWIMPEINGFETLSGIEKVLQKRKKAKSLPFLTYTNQDFGKINLPPMLKTRFIGHASKSLKLHELAQFVVRIIN